MEVLSDFHSQHPLLDGESEPSLYFLSTDSSDVTDQGWQPPAGGNYHMSSSLLQLQRPCSAALSRTNSQASLLVDAYSQDLPQSLLTAKKENAGIASIPLSCRTFIRKPRQKEWRRSIQQVLEGGKGATSFGSPVQRDCYGSPLAFGSPLKKSLRNAEATVAGCGSPATSITSEEQFLRSGSSSVQSLSDDELNRRYVSPSFQGIRMKKELFSAQSEFLCSDGSVSSEAMGSPEVCDLNELMDFMLDDINKDVPAKTSLEQFPVPLAIPSPGQFNPQHSPYCSPLEKPVESSIFTCEQNDLTGAMSQGFRDASESQSGKSGLSVDSCFMQAAAGFWEGQNDTCNGLEEILAAAHSGNFVQPEDAGTVSKVLPHGVCTRKYGGGINIVSADEKSWLYPLAHSGLPGAETEVPCGDVSVASQQLKHGFEQEGLEANNIFGNPSAAGSDSYQMHEIAKFCDRFGAQAPGLVSVPEKLATHLSQTKKPGSKGGAVFEAPPPAPQISASPPVGGDGDYNGIRLVHLLIAGAEAVATRDMDLASVILVRLKELVSVSGSTMQRVAACFSDGLQCRIEGGPRPLDRAGSSESYSDTLAAFQILHEIFPYVKFGHFTANQAILEAIEGEKRVHIVDYEIMEGIQWPSLMQALATRKGGPPHLRITALHRPHGKRGLATVQETGKRLSEFAASLSLPFTFNQLRVDNEEEFRASSFKLIKGEALVANCMLHLPHMPYRTATSVSSFLKAMRKLYPVLLTLVEEELGCNTPAISSYFFEALHHYSAIFDSLEACLSSETVGRMLVERVFLAPRITSAVTFCGRSSASAEVGANFARCNWCSVVSAAGFKSVPLSFHNLSQARLLLGLFKDGFKLHESGNRLLLGWRSKPLIAASAWN